MSTDTIITPCCNDTLPMPDCWRGAPIGQELLRLHLDQCEGVNTMAAEVVAEIEQHLSTRCGFTRHGASGAIFRCVRYACSGYHVVEREDG